VKDAEKCTTCTQRPVYRVLFTGLSISWNTSSLRSTTIEEIFQAI
jgi:hypothetical protein